MSSLQYRSQCLSDLPNIFPKIDHHCEKGPEMEHDIEKDGRFFHTEKGLEEDEVARTADGQKFGHTLYESKKNGLKDIDFRAPLTSNFRFKISDFSI